MLALMMVIGAVLANILLAILLLILPESIVTTYGTLISYPLMFIPAMLYSSGRSRRNEMFDEPVPLDKKTLPAKDMAIVAVFASVATLTIGVLSDPIGKLLPPMPESLEAIFKQMMDGPVWVTLLSVSVFAPFFEEWLCRGMVLRGLSGKGMKPVWAIIVSALFFAVIHMNPWQAVPAFAAGMLFGYVYYRTGSLKLTMLMHCVNNTLAVILGNIESIKDMESYSDIMSTGAYIALIAASLLYVLAFIVFLHAKTRLNFQEEEPRRGL